MPDWSQYVREHLRSLKTGPERESEIASELAQQLEQAYNDAILHGATESEAIDQAQRQFPNWDRLAREINDAEVHVAPPLEPERGEHLLTSALHDLRYAARLLRKSPAFTAIAGLTLALGIGANTAIFTIADALALRGLPYDHPNQLMAIETSRPHQPEVEPWTSAPDFFDLRDRSQSFSSVAAISPIWNNVLTGQGSADRLQSLYVSATFFPLLGVQPALGRAFSSREDQRGGASHVVLISHALWRRRFGENPNALGRFLILDGSPVTILGVMPAGFRYLGEPVAGTAAEIDLWMPLAANNLAAAGRNLRFLKVIGRRKPGVSVEQARDELRRVTAVLADEDPGTNRGFTVDAQPLAHQVQGRLRNPLYLLLAAVGLVLLMACANVANLLLVRASIRKKEISIRIALGASSFRILRQLLTEGFVLACLGGAAGLLFAWLAVHFMIAAGPPAIFQTRDIHLDLRALSFAAAVTLLTAMLSGVAPAWRTFAQRLRPALVAVQIAVAFVLFSGAGLLIHSFIRLLDINPGFDPSGVVTISTQVPPSLLAPEQRTATYRLIREKLLATPGVQSVGEVSRLPLMGVNLGSWLWIEGRPAAPGQVPEPEYRAASPSYFATLRIPLRKGRLFDDRDDLGLEQVALINESAARKYWPAEDPLGKRVKLGPSPDNQPWKTIVGVVGDVRHFGLESDPPPEIYRPTNASPLFAPILVIRGGAGIDALTAAVRSANPGLPVYDVFRMSDLVDRSVLQRRFVMSVLIAFAAGALLLAAIGIYGAASQSVVQRTKEIGIRMALGATPADALASVLREGFRLTIIGVAIGGLLSLALVRLVKSLLFETSPLDPATLVAAALAMTVLSLIACYAPARRATRVDPVIALRVE